MAKCLVRHIDGPAKRLLVSLFVGLCCIPMKAQDNPFYFGLRTGSSNFWSSEVMAVGEGVVNQLIANAINGAAVSYVSAYNYHYMDMSSSQGDVKFSRNNPYGMTAYDLFNDLEAGVKAGWQGETAPIGIGGYVCYGLNQYHLRFGGDEGYGSYKIQSVRVGADITIAPWPWMREDYGWCPVAEVGATYVKALSCKTPYDSDASQANDGLRSRYAIGVQLGEEGKFCLLLSLDMAHYDLLNGNYTPDGAITHPYEGFKSKDMNIGLRLKFRLFEE